jgi:signal peptidase II
VNDQELTREVTAEAPPVDSLTQLAESDPALELNHRSAIWPMLALVTLPIIALDQLSKYLVVAHLAPFQMIALVPHFLDFTYTLNPGAAFSLFANLPPSLRSGMLVAISGFAIIVLAILLIRSRVVSAQTIALAMILGGATGNLADRIVRGRVVDFIYVHYYGLSYPVFNLADSAITIGVGIILLGMFFDTDSHPRTHLAQAETEVQEESKSRPQAGI